jgi:hypothetical protein
MSDLPFVVKIGRGEYVQAPKVRVTWREKRRVKATHTFGDVSFNEVEHAGWDRGGLMFQPCGLGTDDTRQTPIRASGALRQERREVVTVAWTNGHVVRLAEVAPQGDTARELVR